MPVGDRLRNAVPRVFTDATGKITGLGMRFLLELGDAVQALVQRLEALPDPVNDELIENSQVGFYLSEATNELKVRVRYSDGTLKTGTITLV